MGARTLRLKLQHASLSEMHVDEVIRSAIQQLLVTPYVALPNIDQTAVVARLFGRVQSHTSKLQHAPAFNELSRATNDRSSLFAGRTQE